MFGFGSSTQSKEVKKMNEQIFNLQKEKNEIILAQESMNLELKNAKMNQEMALEKDRHKHTLHIDRMNDEFARKEKHWTEDKDRMLKNAKTDKAESESKLKRENEIQLNELKSLTKLESEQQIAQAKLDASKKVQQLEVEHTKAIAKMETTFAKEKSEFQSKLEADYFEKMKKALNDINMEGNAQTKFSQELCSQVINSMRPGNVGVDVNVGDKREALPAATELKPING